MSDDTSKPKKPVVYIETKPEGRIGAKHLRWCETETMNCAGVADLLQATDPASASEASERAAIVQDISDAIKAIGGDSEAVFCPAQEYTLLAAIADEARSARMEGTGLPEKIGKAADELEIWIARKRLLELRKKTETSHEEANEILAMIQIINSLDGSEVPTHEEIKLAAGAEQEKT